MAAEPDEEKRQATAAAMEIGRRWVAAYKAGEIPAELQAEWERADELVFSKIRAMLGPRRGRVVRGQRRPTPPEVLEFFLAIGIEICELWGMSEPTATATLNPRGRVRIGTVGPPLPGVEVKLADDGEVMVRGPIVMKGYRNMPERTAEAIDAEDGWLATGDIGEFDEEGYLKIVDRKKELIINAAGKNMSPASIEAKLKTASPLIAQAVAIGDNRPYNVALLTLDLESLAARGAGARRRADRGRGRGRGGGARTQRLSRVEQIKRFRVLPGEWAPGGEELTPTMKLKRRPIERRYEAEIEALYAAERQAVDPPANPVGIRDGRPAHQPPRSSPSTGVGVWSERRWPQGAAQRGPQRPGAAALRAAAAGDLLQHRRRRDRRQPRGRAGRWGSSPPRSARCSPGGVASRVLKLPRRQIGAVDLHRAQRQHRLPRLPAGGGAARPRPALDRGPLRRPRHRPLPAARRLRGRRRLRHQGGRNPAPAGRAPSSPATRRSTRRSPACWRPRRSPPTSSSTSPRR